MERKEAEEAAKEKEREDREAAEAAAELKCKEEDEKRQLEAAKTATQAIALVQQMEAGFKDDMDDSAKAAEWLKKLNNLHSKWPKDGAAEKVEFNNETLTTWTVPWENEEGEPSVTALLKDLGWDSSEVGDIAKLDFQLFQEILEEEEEDAEPNKTPVCWRHIQEVFRRNIYEEEYDADEDDVFPWKPEDDTKYPELAVSFTVA